MKLLFASCAQPLTAEVEQALVLASGLAARSHQVAWLGAPGSAGLARAAQLGIPATSFPAPDFKRRPSHWIKNLAALRGVLGREAPDALLCLESPVHTLSSLARMGRSRSALMRWRGTALPLRGGPAARLMYEKLTRAVLVPCRKAVEQARSAGLIVDNWHVLGGSVDLARFSPRRPDGAALAELGWRADARILALVARLAPVKGIGVFLESLARVRSSDSRVHALILGEAWEGQEELFRSQVSRLRLDGSVVWLGRRADVERWLSVAELGVVSSVGSEMQSRAALEYLASGLPVAATRVGVLPEWLEGRPFTRLAKPGDPEALAAAILNLLTLSGRGELSSQARHFAENNFSTERFVSEGERILAAALESP